MEKTAIKFKGKTLFVSQEQYNNNRVALDIVTKKGELYLCATVNVPELKLQTHTVLIKNYSENEGILQALIEAKVIQDLGVTVTSGMAKLNVCKLSI